MLPVRKPDNVFNDLEQLQQRKEQLASQLQEDNQQFTTLWHDTFVAKSASNKVEWVSSLLSNSLTAIDAFLLVRKLFKNHGSLFRHNRK